MIRLVLAFAVTASVTTLATTAGAANWFNDIIVSSVVAPHPNGAPRLSGIPDGSSNTTMRSQGTHRRRH
ncbi:MAG: hypothetical protein H6898_14815 [Rhodobacter sp.]|nr:hypothetical protein [Paracoccaceae bacterium]MCC0077830.1 hypothetical protein [Rhodobacter sp.]